MQKKESRLLTFEQINESCRNFWISLTQRAKDSESSYVPLGYLFFFGYMGWYFFWLIVQPEAYENAPLRVIGSLLGLPLILKDKWPKKIQFLMPAYWYGTLIYLMPFFFSFMLFKNDYSVIWQLNGITALVLLILVTDWLSVALIIIIGVTIGWICYILTTPTPYVPPNLGGVISNYLAIVLFCGLFMYRKSKVQKEKIQSMSTLSASIAHELRTPLRTIDSGLVGIQKYLPILIDTYQKAELASIPIQHIRPVHYEGLTTLVEDIRLETQSAFTVIDMLLINLNQLETKDVQLDTCSMQTCVQHALERYPFYGDESKLVHWKKEGDFSFKGNELLMIHVLFNLLKNSLYYIKAADKGEISIWVDHNGTHNRLHFKDTAKGIPADDLPLIFEKFFSKTYHGTGIGLTFCKVVMQHFGGRISCQSEDGEYTEFILAFPKLSK